MCEIFVRDNERIGGGKQALAISVQALLTFCPKFQLWTLLNFNLRPGVDPQGILMKFCTIKFPAGRSFMRSAPGTTWTTLILKCLSSDSQRFRIKVRQCFSHQFMYILPPEPVNGFPEEMPSLRSGVLVNCLESWNLKGWTARSLGPDGTLVSILYYNITDRGKTGISKNCQKHLRLSSAGNSDKIWRGNHIMHWPSVKFTIEENFESADSLQSSAQTWKKLEK